MSPLSWPVLAGTAVVGSPALWAAEVSGTLSHDVALTRLALCAVGVWAVCTVAARLCERVVAANTREMQRPAGVASEETDPVDV